MGETAEPEAEAVSLGREDLALTEVEAVEEVELLHVIQILRTIVHPAEQEERVERMEAEAVEAEVRTERNILVVETEDPEEAAGPDAVPVVVAEKEIATTVTPTIMTQKAAFREAPEQIL